MIRQRRFPDYYLIETKNDNQSDTNKLIEKARNAVSALLSEISKTELVELFAAISDRLAKAFDIISVSSDSMPDYCMILGDTTSENEIRVRFNNSKIFTSTVAGLLIALYKKKITDAAKAIKDSTKEKQVIALLAAYILYMTHKLKNDGILENPVQFAKCLSDFSDKLIEQGYVDKISLSDKEREQLERFLEAVSWIFKAKDYLLVSGLSAAIALGIYLLIAYILKRAGYIDSMKVAVNPVRIVRALIRAIRETHSKKLAFGLIALSFLFLLQIIAVGRGFWMFFKTRHVKDTIEKLSEKVGEQQNETKAK